LLALCVSCLSEDLVESDTFFDESERSVDFGTYIQNWLQQAAIVSTSNIQKYVTLPDKQIPIHFNVTNTEVKAAIGGLTFLGIGAYLFSQIPLPDLSRSDDIDLGFGLQRDLSNYEDEYFPESYEEVFEYEYPDSFYKAASEVSERKVLKPVSKKRFKKPMKKFRDRLQKRMGPVQEERKAPGEGLYDNYWKQKRMLPRRRSMRMQSKSSDLVEDHSKIIGPQMPMNDESERNGPGSNFYKDRITEAYSNYYSK